MKPSILTTIGRPVDPSYPTNRAIAIVTLVVTLGAAVLQILSGLTWVQSALWGVQGGLAVFLAWALCRELDPDHDLSAFVAVALALGGLFLWGLPRLAVLFWLVLILRVVNRTTGLPAGILDSLAALGLSLWLSLWGNWGYGVITVLAFLLDSQLPIRAPRQLVFAILGVVGTAITAILGGDLKWNGAPSVGAGLIALGVSASFLPVMWESRSITSVGDRTGKTLEPLRVQAAEAFAFLVGVETALLGGMPALRSLMPLWAAILGASLYWLYDTLKP